MKPYNLILKLGDKVLFDCTPSDKRSKIKWLKDDDFINETDKRIKYFPDNSLKHILQIDNSNYSDNGTYTCGLDIAGKLINPQTSDVSVLKSMLIHYYHICRSMKLQHVSYIFLVYIIGCRKINDKDYF